MTMITENGFTIATNLLHIVVAKTTKLNRRAEKIGADPITLVIGQTFQKPCSKDTMFARKTDDGQYVCDCVDVTVNGDAPVIEGFRLIAAVECRGEQPIIRRVPGVDDATDLKEFFQIDTKRCDHCNRARVRNDLLIMQNVETDELIQIGRNCAADYFRSKNALAIIKCFTEFAQISNVDHDDFAKGVRGETYVGLQQLLETAAAVTRKFGFAKTTECGNTKGRVWVNLFCRMGQNNPDRVEVNDADRNTAAAVITWINKDILQKPIADRTEFDQNIIGVIEHGMVRERNFGFIVWMPNGLQGYNDRKQVREDREEARKEYTKKAVVSTYLGTVKQRLDFDAKLVSLRYFQNNWGTTAMCRFVDQDGNVIVWWANNNPDINVDTTYKFVATVKKHNEFNSEKQTVITRAKFL